ncbi:MAG: transcription elongation factor GreA [Bdellovibrionaceae bacterium]|nr:transcription elongation factor GreA [Pseudobdellovibrionaceae bacterium]
MTVHGKNMLDQELKRLTFEERPRIIKAIEEARSHGDISENAEYDAAKERQSLIEGRIGDIQNKIATAEVIDPKTIKSEKIVFGATVELTDVDTEETVNYQIVGIDEADVKLGKVSILSPIARALIGKSKGDVIVVQSPKGDKEFEVLDFKFI